MLVVKCTYLLSTYFLQAHSSLPGYLLYLLRVFDHGTTLTSVSHSILETRWATPFDFGLIILTSKKGVEFKALI